MHSHCILRCACRPSVRLHERLCRSFLPFPGRLYPASDRRARPDRPNPRARCPSSAARVHHPLGKRSNDPIPSLLSIHFSPPPANLSLRPSFRDNHPELIFPERYRDLQHVQHNVRPYIPKRCFGIPSLRSVTFNLTLGAKMADSILITVVVEKRGHSCAIYQEDGSNLRQALGFALGRIPSQFVTEQDLNVLAPYLDGRALPEPKELDRVQSTWQWPANESEGVSFRILVIETVHARA